jgi:hypothetical protein
MAAATSSSQQQLCIVGCVASSGGAKAEIFAIHQDVKAEKEHVGALEWVHTAARARVRARAMRGGLAGDVFAMTLQWVNIVLLCYCAGW